MECIYLDSLHEDISQIICEGDESRHLKALRLGPGDEIMITNGRGLSAIAMIKSLGSKEHELKIKKLLPGYGEDEFSTGLAIGILRNRDRFEYALEKAIELGVKYFIPLVCEHTQFAKFNRKRLESKAIAAIKQCKRSLLPKIYDPVRINELFNIEIRNTRFIAAEQDHSSGISSFRNSDFCLIIGPEGGFSENELLFLRESTNVNFINLGKRRLRAETAAIAGLSRLKL
ncbi:MAG: RsmE family RNA methyltransferase [Candidatus Kapaibacterium sp.]